MLPDFAHSLYERFEREGIPLLLAGGWAVCYHGYSRMTKDVDWVCSRQHEAQALELMKSMGFRITFDAMATRFQHPDHLGLPPVDLLWVDSKTFAKMGITGERTGARKDIPVIDFEALLAMKLHALKDQAERKGKDLLDIRELLAENKGIISDGRLRELCERFAGPAAYELIRSNS